MHSEVYYAWSELAPGEDETFISLTEDNGFTPEETAEGTWIRWQTDDGSPNSAILVTDEWLAFADSPEQIADIVWAR